MSISQLYTVNTGIGFSLCRTSIDTNELLLAVGTKSRHIGVKGTDVTGGEESGKTF